MRSKTPTCMTCSLCITGVNENHRSAEAIVPEARSTEEITYVELQQRTTIAVLQTGIGKLCPKAALKHVELHHNRPNRARHNRGP
mmetsp:Transcript_71024/g.134246  ORF Transcript_71024/g.134246 Transcript_71024/m.134246 type:complete len:85 (-) Transcript_71024:283-537(-)